MLNIMSEFLKQIFLWIYCLPVEGLGLCCAFGALLCRKLYHKYAGKPWWRPGAALLLLLWAVIVVWATVFSRETGADWQFQIIPFHSYREVMGGGNRGILRSAFMNVLLFVPAGLLCAWTQSHSCKSGWRMFGAALLFFSFSLTIELAQFCFQLGHGEIDDVLHNTLGAVLGIFMAWWFEKRPTLLPQ